MGSRYGLEIRAAQAGDAPGLAELLGAAGYVVAGAALAERIEALRHGPSAALVAIEWGPPSGLVVLHWYRGLDADAPVAQITTLLVGSDERRRGIGRLLVKSASQAARMAGCGSLQLLVGPGLPALDAFCAATGFEQAGTFYGRPLRKGR
ncbi:MAG: GNAT family N-acetyltransferase [Methylobacterium sp.]|uniref:GNAT family N-acetyltransferase n=1 Tax=Methylobacterium sp. TaxID=409 RepID=UPI0025DFC59F|nr:GNAT family N-acetyltransferase [Methylobacterium sp.]MBX9930348.1 GNAT family N-acetyltransferase [Methylobacterium sp.]